MYKYYQPNKKDIKDKYGDCVIRALTKVMNKTWLEVFDDITPLSREMQCPLDCPQCYIKYLEERGFKKQIVSNKKGSKRPTVSSFADNHKKRNILLERC